MSFTSVCSLSSTKSPSSTWLFSIFARNSLMKFLILFQRPLFVFSILSGSGVKPQQKRLFFTASALFFTVSAVAADRSDRSDRRRKFSRRKCHLLEKSTRIVNRRHHALFFGYRIFDGIDKILCRSFYSHDREQTERHKKSARTGAVDKLSAYSGIYMIRNFVYSDTAGTAGAALQLCSKAYSPAWACGGGCCSAAAAGGLPWTGY